MEIEAKCGACGTRFSLPDEVLKGFWRDGNGKGELNAQPLKFADELKVNYEPDSFD